MENFVDQDALEVSLPGQNTTIEKNQPPRNRGGGMVRAQRIAKLNADWPAGKRGNHSSYVRVPGRKDKGDTTASV